MTDLEKVANELKNLNRNLGELIRFVKESDNKIKAMVNPPLVSDNIEDKIKDLQSQIDELASDEALVRNLR